MERNTNYVSPSVTLAGQMKWSRFEAREDFHQVVQEAKLKGAKLFNVIQELAGDDGHTKSSPIWSSSATIDARSVPKEYADIARGSIPKPCSSQVEKPVPLQPVS